MSWDGPSHRVRSDTYLPMHTNIRKFMLYTHERDRKGDPLREHYKIFKVLINKV